MKRTIPMALVLAVAVLSLPLIAVAQHGQDVPGPICIGDNGHPQCDPPEPVGLEYALEVHDDSGETVVFTFEYAQVAPFDRYQNHVYADSSLIGTLAPSEDESDCETFDEFSVDITDALADGIAVLRIVSGYNENEQNYDDVWLRNLHVDYPAVNAEARSWSSVKALY